MTRESLSENVTLKADLNGRKEIEPSRHLGEEHSEWREYMSKEARDWII